MIALPDDLKRALALSPERQRAFQGLSTKAKADLVTWIETARDRDHRRRRIDMAVLSLR
ncbi:MAG: YdeI/OmpD-associated family protein [Actinobacteria bacterium]|nr:YdeI/OmpD-associated family protein [Actinomycetota bacterium]